MALTSLTAQQVVNRLNGTADTAYSEQGISNIRNNTPLTSGSWQQRLNENLGVPPTYYSQQEALFRTLQSELGLTGSYTQYTEQALLNMAYAASVPIDNVEGEVDGLGTWGFLYLIAAA